MQSVKCKRVKKLNIKDSSPLVVQVVGTSSVVGFSVWLPVWLAYSWLLLASIEKRQQQLLKLWISCYIQSQRQRTLGTEPP